MNETTKQTNLTKFLNTTSTNWKILEEFPNYIITEDGRIWSLARGRFMQPYTDPKTGYRGTHVLNATGKSLPRRIHTLVATAFLGPRPKDKNVNHIDGIKTNNNISNLEYVTQKENSIHAVEKGLIKTLDEHPQATKKNEYVVDAVFTYLMTNDSKKTITEKYGLSFQYLNRVLDGKLRKEIWKDPFLAPFKPANVE
jgi:hypothetical protein